jgi:rubrerythrin
MYQDPGYGKYALSNQRLAGMKPEAIVYTEDPYDIYANLPEALRLIENAITGEAEDRLFYQYLIGAAQSAQDKQIIAGIRDDEMKHYQLFRQLYYEITGSELSNAQNVPFERPASYCEGLQKALMGEQAAVAKYRKILFAMRDRRHINMMTEIITDELRHLGLYNYLYSRNKCKE